MTLRVSNNLNEFISELKSRLAVGPDLEGYNLKLIFTEVHSLLLRVNGVFIVEDQSTKELVMFARTWNNSGIHFEHGLYFFDRITFKNMKINLDVETQNEIFKMLEANVSPPNDFNGVILDGSEYTLKRNLASFSEEYSWMLDSQLKGNMLDLIQSIQKIACI